MYDEFDSFLIDRQDEAELLNDLYGEKIDWSSLTEEDIEDITGVKVA